jgi:hypothetical protein
VDGATSQDSELHHPPSRGLTVLLSVAGVVTAVLGWHALVAFMPPDPTWSSMAVRLGVAALALLPTAFLLWLMVLAHMLARFIAAAFDPLSNPDGPFLRLNQRVITNTVEQFLCFLPALLALAAGTSAARMPEVIAMALIFAAARLVFWLGYLCGPMLRAPGMAATFAAVTAALAGAAFVWLA